MSELFLEKQKHELLKEKLNYDMSTKSKKYFHEMDENNSGYTIFCKTYKTLLIEIFKFHMVSDREIQKMIDNLWKKLKEN